MRRTFTHHLSLIVCLCFVAALLYPCVTWAATCDQWIAKAVSVEGIVEVQRAGETQWQTVMLDNTFCPGDTIRVDDNSRAALSLANQPLLRLDQNTTITLGGVEEKKGAIVDLAQGAIHFFSRISRNLEVRTGFVNAGVEGTEGLVRVEEDRTVITIYAGKVLASNTAGELAVTGGQSAVAEAGKAPTAYTVVRPRDAVQWALYYPPVMLFAPGQAPKEDPGDPRFLAYRASQALSVGRVDEAGADIQQALSLDPNYSDAHALQAVLFVVQNEKEKALASGRKAVETGPNSASALIAMSYAQQASFDLEGARASVETAVNLDPNDALAWARLAELRSSFGELDKGLAAAKKAVELEPGLSRPHMVLGFAYLTQVKTAESRAAFEKAITLDQADPLSRLGLGLAKIRDGDLDAGGREIEIAASLDSNNSIIRSYLGKTYFEKKEIGLDEREYAIAKELDPNDPTPYFYDAIAKQTTNRPVEALHNLEKAKELNDNRAVYRSKLQLDSDLAARSAATARVYSDLGFQQRALVEGWNSVNTDPTNFSAHRFLADTYSSRPRHEIARVSELLQSQLLQPTNITPIQPRLAESNQFLISASGPGGLSFNEFNPLFNRNSIAFQGSALAGSNETTGAEAVISGIHDNLSISSGYAYFQTDGWRDNADQEDSIINLFAQYELSYKTSIQAEYRYRDNDRGDVQLRFFEDDFLPDLRQKDETDSTRIGFRHEFSPSSTLIGNFSYQDADRDLDDLIFIDIGFPPMLEEFFAIEGNEEAYSGELQHLFRSAYVNTVVGGGYFDIDLDRTITDEVFDPFFTPPFLIVSSTERVKTDIDHYNVYGYSYVNILDNLTLTLGASGDFFDRDEKDRNDRDIDEDQFNPKLGITWSPLEGTTLRGAVFRTFKRTLITDQTLEPTQVAGFNQFYDDINATKAWVYGVGVDQKFSRNVYAGAEFTYRDMEVPYYQDISVPPAAPSFVLREADWEEYLGRAYVYWTPHDWFALSAEYQYEKLERDRDFPFTIKDVDTHRVPLGVNFFHPSGLSAGLKATYYYQDGTFQTQEAAADEFQDGDDKFWVVDAAVSYRIPKRHGFITLGVTNLFDEDFEYADIDVDNPSVQPDQSVFFKVTLALP
ncbi:MAG: TonB-dependent receptor [Desulfobacteraceae bacterium]|nr:TonB-dependent receptor [Desulfobacteraceae bacterium]MBC2750550.1 TonB-dependent receptor [Desulfobacteraceae bacterium]